VEGSLLWFLPFFPVFAAQLTGFSFVCEPQGERKIMYSLVNIKGVGMRYANLCCKMAEINLDKRAGELVSPGPCVSLPCFEILVSCAASISLFVA
jgi:hypothetical protein